MLLAQQNPGHLPKHQLLASKWTSCFHQMSEYNFHLFECISISILEIINFVSILCFYSFRAVDLGIGPTKNMRTLTKKYAKKFPDSPKTVSEILAYFDHESIQLTTGKTLRGDEEATLFFKHAFENKDFSYCIFVSDDVVEIINTIPSDRRLYFTDGTFKVCPTGPFAQLMVISIDICGQVIDFYLKSISKNALCFASFLYIQVIPFAYCLMSNRKKITYIAVFTWINDNIGLIDGLKCDTLMADYEVAMSEGFIAVAPAGKLSHCHFHFAQAVKRNAKKCVSMQDFMDR